MCTIISPAVRIAVGMLAVAGGTEVCLTTSPQAAIWATESTPRERMATTQVIAEGNPTAGTAMPDGAATTRIVVPCEVGSPADLVARDLAKVLSAHHGRDYRVENFSPDAAPRRTQQQDSGAIVFFGSNAEGVPVCGD